MDSQTQALLQRLQANANNANNLSQHLQQKVAALETTVSTLQGQLYQEHALIQNLLGRLELMEERLS